MYKFINLAFLLLFIVFNILFFEGDKEILNGVVNVFYYISTPFGGVLDDILTLFLSKMIDWSQNQSLDLYIAMLSYCVGGAIQYMTIVFIYIKTKNHMTNKRH